MPRVVKLTSRPRQAPPVRLKAWLACVVLVPLPCLAQPIRHLEPPSWWIGMAEPVVQLMVHGDDIAALVPTVDWPGVTVAGSARGENPDFLFVDLHIARNARPGQVPLRFERGGKVRANYSYPLALRDPRREAGDGFDGADVIYLITPDRFANGDPANDSLDGLYDKANRSAPDGRHGGDLAGVARHLDYVAGMGFTRIWLNPVLENNQTRGSYHGYAATDLYRVDPRLGDNDGYRALSRAARARGVGLIHDVVLNHVGLQHWWLADLPAPDWINHDATFSPTNHLRESLRDPHGVDADRRAFADGWFVPTMPDLNQRNPQLATYLIQNTVWWIEYAALSGLRVDTWPYSDKDFLVRWTQRVRSEYPQINIVGEEWSVDPAIVSYWQQGGLREDDYPSALPSVMDFPLQEALVRALTEPQTWKDGLVRLYRVLAADYLYGDPGALVIFADNHDMSRIYTQVDHDDALFRMTMASLLTLRGIPQVFYGTEIQMANPGTDAHGVIRSDFPGGWPGDTRSGFTGDGLEPQARAAQQYLRTLLRWRRTASAVHRGALTHFAPRDGVYVWFRHDERQRVMVILNTNAEPVSLALDRFAVLMDGATMATDVATGAERLLGAALSLAPESASILELNVSE